MQEKEYYLAPEAELIQLAQTNSLLTTFSGNSEIWEDDEVYEDIPND